MRRLELSRGAARAERLSLDLHSLSTAKHWSHAAKRYCCSAPKSEPVALRQSWLGEIVAYRAQLQGLSDEYEWKILRGDAERLFRFQAGV